MTTALLEHLPEGVRSRTVEGVNGLNMHVLEAGSPGPGSPTVLLLHGFPELAFSWRRVMPALAAAGLHVVAPDQRGYGRTTGWEQGYDVDLARFSMFNLVRDALELLWAMDIESVAAVVGHDFGSPVAAWCALIRPDVFRSVAMMSAPFGGAPVRQRSSNARASDLQADLAALPRPRKHYQWYYSTPDANDEMLGCEQGVRDFLRAYFHVKSADWSGNDPHPLSAFSADALATLPTYYVMDRDENMADTVAEHMPSPEEIAACAWLPESDLDVYAEEYAHTGFQGGLNWYRCGTSGVGMDTLKVYAGRRIEVPSIFVGGRSDWGVHQTPGALQRMQESACADMRGVHMVDGAGHWVQQEQPEVVADLLLGFLGT